MSLGDFVVASTPNSNTFLDERKLAHVPVRNRWWEAGLEKATAASIMTAMHPPRCRTVVNSRVKREGTENKPDQNICFMGYLKADWQFIDA